MHDWAKVVTDPLGLVGFTLFLLFGALSRLKRRNERSWMVPAALGMAFVALAGGLTLAFLRNAQPAVKAVAPGLNAPAAPSAAPAQVNQQVEQKTTGAGSPAVQGVQGNVTITVDQSDGTWKKKPQTSKPTGKTAP